MLWLPVEASGFITLGTGHLQSELPVAGFVFHAIWLSHSLLRVRVCMCECVFEDPLPVTSIDPFKCFLRFRRQNTGHSDPVSPSFPSVPCLSKITSQTEGDSGFIHVIFSGSQCFLTLEEFHFLLGHSCAAGHYE